MYSFREYQVPKATGLYIQAFRRKTLLLYSKRLKDLKAGLEILSYLE